jgi:hypothetical protein
LSQAAHIGDWTAGDGGSFYDLLVVTGDRVERYDVVPVV